jgi:hypothetical protein
LSSLATAADVAPRPRANTPAVVIVTSSAVEAFAEAVRGVRQGLGSAVKVAIVDLAPEPMAALETKDVQLMVTVGNNALDRAARLHTAPILATMLLRADLSISSGRPASGAVVLDVPLSDILTRMASVLPGKTRAAVIRNSAANNASPSSLVAQAKTVGMTLLVAECPRPEKLLETFLSLKGQVDFVICPPDGTLFNSTTVRPLILASLENRLPVVGFSESFARTGAVASVYPDYYEVGVQAGEAARRFLEGSSLPANEGPRKVKVAINPRVARLMGIRLAPKKDLDSGIVVIE